MRSVLALICLGLGITACSSGGSRQPVETVPEPTRVTRAPVQIEVEQTEAPVDPRCSEIARIAEAGDHKPAVDLFDDLLREAAPCPPEVQALATVSRVQLGLADDFVRSSTAKKQAGDVRGARADLASALEAYPKYYWAKKLLRDLGEPPAEQEDATGASAPKAHEETAEVGADVEVLRQLIAEQNLELARIAEHEGDLPAAQRWAIQALKSEPGDPALREDIVEYARLLGLKFFSAGELTPARDLWVAALSLDSEDARLRSYLRQVDERLQNLEEIRSKSGSR